MNVLEFVANLVKLVFAAGVLAALAWYVLRPMIRSWRQQPDPQQFMPKLPDLSEEELQVPTDGSQVKPDRNTMMRELKADPHKSAMLLKKWLSERPERKTK